MVIWLSISEGGALFKVATCFKFMNLPGKIIPNPMLSIPLLPALPDIWANSLGVNGMNSTPLNRSEFRTTTDRAGKLTPAATVDVANMASSNPSAIRVSTTTFHAGRWPLWWDAVAVCSRYLRWLWFARCGLSEVSSLILLNKASFFSGFPDNKFELQSFMA